MNDHNSSFIFFALNVAFTVFSFTSCHPLNRRDPLLPADRIDLPLRIEHIKGGVYSVEDGNFWKTNSVFWIGDDDVYFFDATWQPASANLLLFEVMSLTTLDFRGLILTSAHQSRAGGAQSFVLDRIPVLIQQNAVSDFEKNWLAANDQLSESFLSWRRTPLPDLKAAIDKKLTLADGKIEVIYPGEGWSADNLVVLFRDERLLYGGSLVAYPPLFTATVDRRKVLQALKIVEALPFDRVISGHGKVIQDRSIFKKLKQYYTKQTL